MDTRNKAIDSSVNEKLTKSFLDNNEKHATATSTASSLPDNSASIKLDDKMNEIKSQEDQLEILKQKSEEASKTIERLKMQLKQQSDYELLKREVL